MVGATSAPFLAPIAALSAALLVLLAERLHARRTARVTLLAFGPQGPEPWTRAAPALRALAAGALAWGLVTLLLLPAKVHQAEGAAPDDDPRHVVLVLDVSPSMRLQDAGPNLDQGRMQRAAVLLESFFDRVPITQYRLSVIAVYNGAKRVVEETRDLEVVRNILSDLPMHYAFKPGKTRLFDGLEEAARLTRPWNPGSAVVLLVSDGDTVPATGMPRFPPSVREVLVVGVGDPRAGKFIDGRQSRQDVATLRQIAARLGGVYHDGNNRHLSSETIARLARTGEDEPLLALSEREYALLAIALGALTLSLLPLALERLGSRWAPAVATSVVSEPRALSRAGSGRDDETSDRGRWT